MIAIDVMKWDGQKWVHASMQVPALPRVGDHIHNEQVHLTGYVKDISFWWDADGVLLITVAIK